MSVDVQITDGVAVITLNRPERKNAFDRAQYDELAGRLDAVAADDSLRVAVLTGAGAAFRLAAVSSSPTRLVGSEPPNCCSRRAGSTPTKQY